MARANPASGDPVGNFRRTAKSACIDLKIIATKIGQRVIIVQGCFLEESRPWLIEIEDDVMISARVTIVTHDAVYHHVSGGEIPYRYGKVVLKQGCVICPGSIIMRGVTVGNGAVVAPGSVVNKDVPDGVIVAGSPAKYLMTVEEGAAKCRGKIGEYTVNDKTTKYPWRLSR